MARSRKPSKTNTRTNTKQESYGFRRGYWLHLFLGLLAAYSLYVIILMTASTGRLPISANIESLMFPGASSLLVVVFSVLFLFFAARKRTLPMIAKACAYLLVCLSALAFIATFIMSSNASTTTSGLNFAFFVLFHNPYVSLFNSVVSLVGIVTLIVKLIRRNK